MKTPLLPLASLLLAGCIADNARDTLGRGTTLPEFDEPRVSRTAPADRRPDLPSLTSLDRSHWPEQVVLAEPDGAAHRPTYARPHLALHATSRQRGDPPTPGSALEGQGVSRRDLYTEAFLAPAYALLDLVTLPYYFYKHPEWKGVNRGPAFNYWRAPVGTKHGYPEADDQPADGQPPHDD